MTTFWNARWSARPTIRGARSSKAHVVLVEGASADDAMIKRLQDHVKATIAPYKYPRRVIFTDAAEDRHRQDPALPPARQLARYLLTMRDNDHVELHEVRGFVSDDLRSAFLEADAIAAGTRCTNHLFSISLNPPQDATVTTEEFEAAANEVERKLGLEGQPRAIVFHEKDGRRHAHVVWSRIDAEHMRAINLSHYKLHLRDVSRELFRAHGWDMPKGLRDWRERDPLTFSREEWQQARRAGLDPKQIKALFQECWERSDTGASLPRRSKSAGSRSPVVIGAALSPSIIAAKSMRSHGRRV
jgi:hypothetical protein